jgi:anti-anti-sigma regulatory factor
MTCDRFVCADRIGITLAFVPWPVRHGATHVLRITQSNGCTTTTLKVEGKLTRHSIGEFARTCLPHLDRSGDLVLDFSAVGFVDDAGAAVVRDLVRRSVRIRGCSALVSNLLKEPQE